MLLTLGVVMQNYHDSYYHPSNGVFWFYGNDPPVERLRVLDEYLSNFDKKVVKSEIDRQPLLKEPQRIEDKYAAGEQDDRVMGFSYSCQDAPCNFISDPVVIPCLLPRYAV